MKWMKVVERVILAGLVLLTGAESTALGQEARGDAADRVLMVNVNGAYNGDAASIGTTLTNAGADSTYVTLSSNGQVAALLEAADPPYDQVWVFDLSTSSDNYPADWAAIADWFDVGSMEIICDGRMISSYWSGRWTGEGQQLTENYYENLRSRGGGVVIGTDHNSFHNNGTNQLCSALGLNPFVGNFSLSFIPIDEGSPIMSEPNAVGSDAGGGERQLYDDSSPGQAPFGVQPNGRILYSVAWHSGNVNTPGITTTIQGEVGLVVQITEPTDDATYIAGQEVTFNSTVSNQTDPVTYTWTSSLDGELASGEAFSSFSTSALSVGMHTISVLASDAALAADADEIDLTILPAPDLQIVSIDSPVGAFVNEQTEFSFTVMNHGPGDAPATTVDAYFSDTASIGSDTFIASVAVPALASGESTDVTVTWTPEFFGIYWIVGYVDPTDSIFESDEANNPAIDTESFSIDRRPDIQVTDITVSMCPSPEEGGMIEVSWTVTRGEALPGASWSDEVALFVPGSGPARGGDAVYVLGTFAGNGPDDYTRTETVMLPPGVDGDSNMIRVTSDVNDDVAEGPGESNNVLLDDQNLDLSGAGNLTLFCWSQEGPPGNGNWTVSEDGQSVYQSTNGNPTYFVSDFDLNESSFEGSFRVNNDGDDDYIGFVFGFKGLGGVGVGEGYYLFSWKKGNQSSGGALGEAGFKVAKITGTSPNLWDMETQAGQMEVLARMDGDNAFGWQHNTDYSFFLSYQTSGSIRVIIRRTSDGQELWNTGLITDPDPLGVGRVGFYNYSQSQVTYAGFTSAELEPPISAPGGPYVMDATSSSIDVDASASVDPDGATGTIADIQSFQWDLGDDGIADDAGRVNVTESIPVADVLAKGLALGVDVALGLEVSDVDGLTGVATGSITYQSTAPIVNAGGPYGPVSPGGAVQLMGMVDDPDIAVGVGDSVTFEWDTSPAMSAAQVGDGFATILDPMLTFDDLASQNTVYLNAVDAAGLVSSTSVTIPLSYPDLVASGVTAPTTAAEGTDITVSWTVTNSGDLDAIGTWTDSVYLSEDMVLSGDDVMVGMGSHTDLGATFSYQPSLEVGVPDGLTGMHYVIVATDTGDVINEGPAEGNNVAVSATPVDFFADCNGNGQPDFDDINTTLVSTDCNDNGIPDECELALVYTEDFEGTLGSEWSDTTRFDSSVATFTRFSGRFSNIDAPSSQTLTLPTLAGADYTVTFDLYIIDSWDGNSSPGPDYFVVDIDGVESFRHTFNTFGDNQSYPEDPEFRQNYGWGTWADSIYRGVSISFTAADGDTPITFFSENLQGITDESWGIDNVRVISSGSGDCNGNGQLDTCDIADGTSEDTNGNGIPDECEDDNDLRLVSITAPTSGVAGEEISVTWEVINDGDDAVVAEAAWQDRVYISDDPILDGGDPVAATISRNGPLAPGASYTGQADITLPDSTGDHWVIVHSDYNDTVEEFGNEANNAAADDTPVDVLLPPDLIVVSIDVPSGASVGETISLTWTVRNDGALPVSGTWADRVFQSSDDSVGSDQPLGTFFRNDTLDPGESYTATQPVTLAAGLSGQQYFVVETDANDNIGEGGAEDNNTTVSDPFDVTAPDLVVESIEGPTTATVGDNISVTWTVTNEGDEPAVGTWIDRILMSADDALGGDIGIASFAFTGTLGIGESYSRTEIVTLAPGASGMQYLVVRTDFNAQLDEGGADGNNARIDDVAFEVTAPDLIVTSVTVPASAGLGESVEISWTIRNQGNATMNGTWSDRVLQSTDASIGGDTSLAVFTYSGTLAPTEEVTRTEMVTLSAQFSGEQRLVVAADALNNIDEGGAESNNSTISGDVIDVSAPDLVVAAIVAPASASVRDLIDIEWTVMNNGDEAASGSWSDQVALSSDASIGGDTVIGTFGFDGSLEPGETYTQMRSVVLPASAINDRWVVIRTDVNNALAEGSGEGNNTSIDDTFISILGPDLVVESISAPSSGVHGQEIMVEWMVRNAGDDVTIGNWVDGIYLSQDAAYDSGDQLMRGEAVAVSPLDIDETYMMSAIVTIPLNGGSVDGTHYVLLRTNASGSLIETDGGNNVGASMPIELTRPDLPNLQVTAIEAPVTGAPGDTVDVQWTVTNTGTQAITGQSWGETIHLSSDGTIGNDLAFSAFVVGDDLEPGGSVVRTRSIQVPDFASNQYFVRIETDNSGSVLELEEGDNNSISSTSANILRPDLVVDTVVGPFTGTADAQIEVMWTVTNQGSAPVNGVFIDRVYLSTDTVLNEQSDRRVLTLTGPQTLGIGSSYMRNQMVTVPGRIEGPYFVIVRTNANGALREVGDAALNTKASSTPVIIDQPLRPNLVVTDIQTPAGGLGGTDVDVTFEVTNLGDAPATGFWTDRIFVSDDPFFGPGDPSAASVVLTEPLGVGESYEITATIRYPSFPDQYYLVARTDDGDAVNEGLAGGESDNVLADTASFVVTTYSARVDADVTSGIAGTPVNLTGQAFVEGRGTPAAGVPVDIRLNVQGARRLIRVETNEVGEFSTTFRPLANEGGLYAVAAAPPHVSQDIPQDQFSLFTMVASPVSQSLVLYPGTPRSGQITLRNPGDLAITGLGASVENLPSGVTLNLTLSEPFIPANGVTTVDWTLEATEEVAQMVQIDAVFTSSQGNSKRVPFYTTVAPNRPNLVASPNPMVSEMLRGEQTIIEVLVTNVGGAVAQDIEVLLPPVDWLQLGIDDSLPDLAPGASATVILHLLPAEDQVLGTYEGSISITGDDGAYGVGVPYVFTATSDLTGDLAVRIEDEFTYWSTGEYEDEGGPVVPGAMVRITDPYTGDIIAEGITDPARGNEPLIFEDVPEGSFDMTVTAPDHNSYRGTVHVTSGDVNYEAPFIPRQSVTYTWTVEQIEIDDSYIFTLETTFATAVPVPVITVDPPMVDLEALEEDVTQIDFVITNHGLIQNEDADLNFGDHPNFIITPLVEDIGAIPAESSITVPVVFERVVPRDVASRSEGPCEISGDLTWTLICNGENSYVVPIILFNASGKCTSGTTGVPPGVGVNPDVDPWVFEGFPGSPGNPFDNPPVVETEEQDCPCTVPPPYSADISPYLAPLKGPFKNLINSIPRVSDASVDFEGEVLVGLICCDDDSIEGYVEGSAGAEVSAKLTLVGATFSRSGSTELEVTDINGNPVSLSWEFTAEAGCFLHFDGSASGTVRVGGCDDDPLTIMGNGSIGANLCCSAGVMGSATLSAPVPGVDDLTASFDASIGICTGAEASFTYDDDSGFDGDACFRGVWIEGGLNFSFPGIGGIDIIPSGSKYYLVDGTCDEDGRNSITVHHDSFRIGDRIREDLEELFRPVRASYVMTPETVADVRLPASEADRTADRTDSVCAEVQLELEQEVVISRTAFQATLEIVNGNALTPVEDIFVDVFVEDAEGNDVTDLFAFQPPILDGLSGIDGTGMIPPEDEGSASFILIPTRDAAPMELTEYFVAGTLAYTDNGVSVQIPLAPSPISVAPDPLLVVKYFWQRDVYSDDPFTEEVEPSEPFSLGMTMSNIGYGDARNVRVASSQPRIVENDRGLLIAFELVGTEIGTSSVTPSLAVNLGDIMPGSTAFARWLMTSTLQGQFTEYEASFEHVDSLGDARISLIDSVEIFELIHVVRDDEPEGSDDRLPDFMTNEIPDPMDLDFPDTVHLSDGRIEDVTVTFGAMLNGPIADDDVLWEATVTLPDGYVYWQFDDPTNGQYPLTEVIRSDGKQLLMPWNAWQTDRTFRDPSEQPIREHKIQVFDRGPSGQGGTFTYTMRFGADAVPPAISRWQSIADHGATVGPVARTVKLDGTYVEPRESGVSRLFIEFDEPIDPTTFVPASVQLDGLDVSQSPIDLVAEGVKITTTLQDMNRRGVITFSPALPDVARYRLELVGVADFAGNLLPGGSEIYFTALLGDTTGDGRVNNTDVGAVASLLGTNPINPGVSFQVRSDINVDGRIDNEDLDLVLARRGTDARFIPDPVPSGGLVSTDGIQTGFGLDGGASLGGAGVMGGTSDAGMTDLDGDIDQPRTGLDRETDGQDDMQAGLFGNQGHGYTYFGTWRPLRPASSTMLVRARDGMSAQVSRLAGTLGITDEPWLTGAFMTWHSSDELGGDAEQWAEEIAAYEPVGYVSPLFTTDEGGQVALTPRIIVGFDRNTSPELALTLLGQIGLGNVIESDWAGLSNVYLVQSTTVTGFETLSLANRAAAMSQVAFAEPVVYMTGTDRVAPSRGDAVDAAGLLHLPAAWSLHEGTCDATVAMLSDGVETGRPELTAVSGFDFTEADTGGAPETAYDVRGTACAGRIAGMDMGAAPGASIVSLRTQKSIGASGMTVTSNAWIVEALEAASQAGARVSMTTGVHGFASAAVASQYARTRDLGMTHFAPSGSSGSQHVGLPARLSSVVAVGSTDASGMAPANFSDAGPAVIAAAPGMGIRTLALSGDQAVLDGTSLSASHAAGLAALAVSVNPDLSPADIEALLAISATDIGQPGRDIGTGHGLLHAWRLMRHAGVPGDADGDGAVTMADLEQVLDDWAQTGLLPGDVTADERVDFDDLSLVLDMMAN